MARVRSAALVALTTLALSCGCGSHGSGGERRIDPATGKIGPLRLDHSRRRDVIAFAGRPGADWRWPGARGVRLATGYPAYEALGYDCAKHTAPSRRLPPESYPDAKLPVCRTIFFLDNDSGKLISFLTSDPRYSETQGVHVGMPTGEAERLLHRRVRALGCNYADVSLGGIGPKSTLLLIQFTGGEARPPRYHLVGGHVADFHVNTLGLFDCG